MFVYRSRFLTRCEVWYDDEPEDAGGVDWIFHHRRSRPVPGAGAKYFHTYAIDLTRKPGQLLANLNKDTAYKVRRARERDKITCESRDPRDPKVMDHFEQMFNAFAAIKGLTPLERARTESVAAAGLLDLSAAKDPQGNVLVYHANYRGRQRASGMRSVSLYRALSDSAARSLIGRANCCLIWHEILRYQEQGLKWFDLGGWHHGADPAMLKINDFKRGFGGQILREYEGEQVRTLKGWLALRVAGLRQRAKLLPRQPARVPAKVPRELVHGGMSVPVL